MEMKIEFGDGKKVNALFNGFTVLTDQPRDLGGLGSAPAPYELFLASIGTCAASFVLGFCQARGIDASGIKMRARFSVNEKSNLVEKARIEMDVPDDFPEKHLPTLERVVQMCSVKRSLLNPPDFLIKVNKKN